LIRTLFIVASNRLSTKRLPAPLVGMFGNRGTKSIFGKSRTKKDNRTGLSPPDHSAYPARPANRPDWTGYPENILSHPDAKNKKTGSPRTLGRGKSVACPTKPSPHLWGAPHPAGSFNRRCRRCRIWPFCDRGSCGRSRAGGRPWPCSQRFSPESEG
jgi:hypothetical protein